MGIQTNERHGLTAVDVFFDYNDLKGISAETVEIPAGSVILGGFIVVDKPFTGIGNFGVSVGDSASLTRYGAGLKLHEVAKRDLTVSGLLTTKTERLRLNYSQGTLTAGRARLHLWYTQVNRADFTQGL